MDLSRILIAVLETETYYFVIKKSKKEQFYNVDRQCESIYGPNHPKCYQKKANDNRLEHVGYFKINTIKYPLLDLNTLYYSCKSPA